jgi:hypothetical protein
MPTPILVCEWGSDCQRNLCTANLICESFIISIFLPLKKIIVLNLAAEEQTMTLTSASAEPTTPRQFSLPRPREQVF